MSSLKQTAILLGLVRQMREKGNWCGETHIQKGVYLFQDLAGGDTSFDFVLYHHGPFSFELRDGLTALRSDGLLELKVQQQPYGPKLFPTNEAETIESKFPRTLEEKRARLEFTAGIVGDNGVGELERLSTALFLTRREHPGASVDDRAKRLNEIKPHISLQSASDSVKKIDKLLAEAREAGFIES